MTTYPKRQAIQRADMYGYELEIGGFEPLLRHHRTKRHATLRHHDIGAGDRFSDHWWLDLGDEIIDLLGARRLTDA